MDGETFKQFSVCVTDHINESLTFKCITFPFITNVSMF